MWLRLTRRRGGPEAFKQLAEQLTRARVKVRSSEQHVYKDKEELEACMLGSVQMLAPSLAKFDRGVKEFECSIFLTCSDEAFCAR